MGLKRVIHVFICSNSTAYRRVILKMRLRTHMYLCLIVKLHQFEGSTLYFFNNSLRKETDQKHFILKDIFSHTVYYIIYCSNISTISTYIVFIINNFSISINIQETSKKWSSWSGFPIEHKTAFR